MTYITLGSRGPITGVADNTQLNTGNWTVSFTPDVINVNVPQAEVYKIVVSGAPNTTFNVYVDRQLWDVGVYGALNSWDPQMPLVIRPGQALYFCYSDAISDGVPPIVTIWLRYDNDLTNVSIKKTGLTA